MSTGPALVPDPAERAALTKSLSARTGELTSLVVQAMEESHPWFTRLGAEERSWITLVARSGIDNFITWFGDDTSPGGDPGMLFNAAPRALTRKISLHQTVDLVRTTIEVVAQQIESLVPPEDQQAVNVAILQFSRDVAFAAAEVYARAAELRGGWDERMEALIVDAVVRAEADEMVLSRASALGWRGSGRVCVAVGPVPVETDLDGLRRDAGNLDLDVLTSVQGGRLIVIASGKDLVDEQSAAKALSPLGDHFDEGTIVVGPPVDDLTEAADSARMALSAARTAHAWPSSPRVVTSWELLPERAVDGDPEARRALVDDIYRPLVRAKELLHTCVSFLDHGCSVETTARDLFVHPNTVRYRVRRISEITGYSPAQPRQAYVLHLAITLGRLAEQEPQSSPDE
ncbi:PucR family transcriptional regulator [Propionibacterium sp.]|uniref:PucR family transcriptional regulator n=1 Tax=Propionibacterium sp. TaxID=1977903 RepID=UPI0039E97D8C